jgi:hypothetical protein
MAPLDFSKPFLFTITAFLDSKRLRPVKPAPHRMKARYDLSSIKTFEKNEYGLEQGISTESAKTTFYATKSKLLSVKLILNDIDLGSYGLADLRTKTSKLLGSASAAALSKGANASTITSQVELFERLCQSINGDSHEPSYLRLDWSRAGLRSSFEGRLEEFEVSYTLIAHDGTPLLAEIDATFIESVEPKKQLARIRLSSPDLSHRHLVVAGETLPMLCRQYYNSTTPYLQVATFNGLDDFVFLEPGSELLFPPLASQEGDD